MKRESFIDSWRVFHPRSHPVGYLMKWSEAERWVRFHSLPESKRYAESDSERELILSRARALAGRILGNGLPAWVVETRPESVPPMPPAYELHFVTRFVDENIDFAVRAGLVAWDGAPFDSTVISIADDVGPRTLWMSPKDGAVFAPYDGGFDLFPATAEDVISLKSDFPHWLSRRDDGL